MSLRPDHKALVFLGTVAVLGAAVRVVRASARPTAGEQPELEHQVQAADSSWRAGRGGRAGRGARSGGRGRGGRGRGAVKPDSGTQAMAQGTPQSGDGALDRRGYINGKLDLDVATAAQINALPGVSATMARRIVLDRAMRGPFITRDGLRRVTGAGPAFVARIDSLVTFTGTVVQPSASDTVIARTRKVRAKPVRRPAAPRTAVPRPTPSRP
jgi:Helix-hairpin-helix motif